MIDPLRQEIATLADTLVVKVGTRVLTRGGGVLNEERVTAFAEQLAAIARQGRRVALVSSGAVGAGMGRLGISKRPTGLAELQAAAALGQSVLIEAYNRALEKHGFHAAQILLTADDINDRARCLNVRNTILALFRYGAIPIINENDTVRVEELQLSVGDNDRLAAMVTNMIRAPLLVLLSDVDGLYDGHPRDPSARVIPVVKQIDAELEAKVCDVSPQGNQLSRGGMASKLEAARQATTAGENVIIANGGQENVLLDILAGKQVGTLFLAEGKTVASRKRWIGLTARSQGKLFLDAGACRAIQGNGSSLLAIGVLRSEGKFQKGDVVSLCDESGVEFARGLTNYRAEELSRIVGESTDRIAEILGQCPYDEVVHRDNLSLVH